MSLFIPVYRPDNLIVWIPESMQKRLGIAQGDKLSGAQWQDPELLRLIEARKQAGENKTSCDPAWHKLNGFV